MRVAVALLLVWHQCSTAQILRGSVVPSDATRADLEAEFVKSGGDRVELAKHQEWLLPLWNALPKDKEGLLEPPSARYALHRLFTGRFGWYVKGLEPEGNAWASSLHEDTLEDWVPPAVLPALQGQGGATGFTLKELGILGAAVSLRNHNETTDFMASLYRELKFPTDRPLEVKKVQQAIYYYVTRFLSGRVYTASGAIALAENNTKKYTDWPKVQAWYDKIQQEHLGASMTADLATAVRVAMEVGERYASMNQEQCHDLKEGLTGLWAKSNTTGRIRLTDFYRFGLGTQWDLDEKAGYLKSVGALDDSNASSPMVIIPNYLTLWRNCMQATQLYTVCCRNECEDLVAHLEREIAAPAASPERLLELVSRLPSETVTAPRHIAEATQARLRDIATRHGGQVHLHGRLFAQWLHHAYPNECPFPHVKGTSVNIEGLGEASWEGEEEASEEERRALLQAETCGPEEASERWQVELPWSDAELLLSPAAQDAQAAGPVARTALGRYVMVAALLSLLAGFFWLPGATSLRRRVLAPALSRGWSESRLFLVSLLLLGLATGLVNRVLLLVAVGLLTASKRTLVGIDGIAAARAKKEKNLDVFC